MPILRSDADHPELVGFETGGAEEEALDIDYYGKLDGDSIGKQRRKQVFQKTKNAL